MTITEQMQSIHSLSGLRICYYKQGELYDQEGESILPESYEQKVLEQLLASGRPYCYQLTQGALVYGLIRLEEASDYCLVGPMTLEPDDHRLVQRLSVTLHMPVSETVWEYAQKLKVMHIQSFFAYLHITYLAFHSDRRAEVDKLHQIVPEELNMHPIRFDFSEYPVDDDAAIDELLFCIEHGKAEEAQGLVRDLHTTLRMPGSRGIPVLRLYQDAYISVMGLFTRAAVHGGMERSAAISISDQCIERIEKVRSVAEIGVEFQEMVRFYAEQVSFLQKLSGVAEPVRNTAAFIRAHSQEKITVARIAEALNMNPDYISHIFREQMGTTITDYIADVKISEAKSLLHSSKMSIMEISHYLGFSSQQYFQQVFKKKTGFTPKEFKKDVIL